MVQERDILNCPNRTIILEYKLKDAPKRVSKIVMTTDNPKELKDKDDSKINFDELLENAEELFVIPIH